MTDKTNAEAKDKLLSLLKDAHIGMMATTGPDGRMHARPMGTNHVEFDGDLWFLTDRHSGKIDDIERDATVLVTYADTSEQHYISVTGRGEIVRDRETIKEQWFEAARTWFPKGPDDPEIALIKVHVENAEYWDSPSSTALYLYGYLKAVTTGERPKGGENETVTF
jgi:general stress protein 26